MSKYKCPKCKGEFDKPSVEKRGYNWLVDAYCPFCREKMEGLTSEMNK